MATFKVTGGTHLGIVSCYGEKIFYVNREEDLAEAVRRDMKVPESAKLTTRTLGNKTVWMFENERGETLFEFYYEWRSGRDAKERT